MQQHQQSRLDEAAVGCTAKSNSATGPSDGGISVSARSGDSSVGEIQNQQNMGKLTITLENSTVHAGTFLKGRISVVSSKSEVDKIQLKLDGVGTVRLDADNGKTYAAQEVYLCDKMLLWSRRENVANLQTGKGIELTVPFEYPVNCDAQASFDGHYARILYTCTAIVKYVGALGKKQQTVSRFLVLPRFDSNQLSENVSGQKVQKRKTFSSFGINDGVVEVDLDMDKVVVQRGDEIGFTVTVNNLSQLHLRSLKFGIIQLVTSIAKGRQIVEKHAVIEFDEDIYLKPNQIWQGRRICTIAQNLQPTLMARGNKIDCRVSYCFFVSVIPPNFSNNCELTYPLYVY